MDSIIISGLVLLDYSQTTQELSTWKEARLNHRLSGVVVLPGAALLRLHTYPPLS